ncbi:MAG: hypothetical protein BWY59_01236 [Verrucomicrobia bacterium ADurb.Bin345]|nr:MAG: hypothetical protein BWY59_01236 [Verrucomicrobia bacterium ADurb.Bin345]
MTEPEAVGHIITLKLQKKLTVCLRRQCRAQFLVAVRTLAIDAADEIDFLPDLDRADILAAAEHFFPILAEHFGHLAPVRAI